jgi:hypothetical protein
VDEVEKNVREGANRRKKEQEKARGLISYRYFHPLHGEHKKYN